MEARREGADYYRPQPLDSAVRPLRGRTDDRARRHGRERRPAVRAGRPRLLAVEPRLGRERVPDRVRRAAPAGRPARRPAGPQAHLHDRPRRVHRSVTAVRSRADTGDAGRCALHPGHRRRDDLRRGTRNDRHDVSRAARTGQGDRRIRVCRLRRWVGRAAGGRHPDGVDQLALDLLREHPDRRCDRPTGAAPAGARRGHRLRRGRRRARRHPDHQLPDARRLHDREAGGRAGLGRSPDLGARRRIDRTADRLRGTRVAGAQPADPAADLPVPQRLGSQRDPGAVSRRDVRDVLPRLALPRAGAALLRARDRPCVPARRRS